MSSGQYHEVGPASGSFDALAVLRQAGHPIDLLSKGQQQVFATLSRLEVELLNSIKRRLDAASEVEAQEVKIL